MSMSSRRTFLGASVGTIAAVGGMPSIVHAGHRRCRRRRHHCSCNQGLPHGSTHVVLGQAGYCPLTRIGQWNGVHHYYAVQLTAQGRCPPSGAQQYHVTSVNNYNLGCNGTTCSSVISGGGTEQGRGMHIVDGEPHIGKKVSKHKPGGKLGEGEDLDGTFIDQQGTLVSGVKADFVVKVEIKGSPYLFRVLTIESTSEGVTLETMVAQQVEETDGENATFDGFVSANRVVRLRLHGMSFLAILENPVP